MAVSVLISALLILGFGALVLWANPDRPTNRAYAIGTVLGSAWFACVYGAVIGNELRAQGLPANPHTWHRANAAIVPYLFAALWVLKNLIVSPSNVRRAIIHSLPWIGIAVGTSTLALADSFIGQAPLLQPHVRGAAYYAYSAIGFVTFLLLTVVAAFQSRRIKGLGRLEMQYLVSSLSVAGFVTISISVCSVLLDSRSIARIGPFVFLLGYLITGWGLTYHRLFNIRTVCLVTAHRAITLLIFALATFACWQALNAPLGSSPAFLASVIACGLTFPWLDRSLRKWLDVDESRKLNATRTLITSITQTATNRVQLIAQLEQLFAESFGASSVRLGSENKTPTDMPALPTSAHALLVASGWATPESLQRRRRVSGSDELAHYLQQQTLGLVVCVPVGNPSPSLTVFLGTKTNGWPYTYPEIQQIRQLSQLCDNILTSSRLSAQAALEARLEHLAMMSRGLAHDLKNLITPISSFLVHAEPRIVAGSVEHEVHTAAKRSVRIMNEYIREALFFANRLEPRFENVSTGKLFESVRELTASRAAWRQVKVVLAIEHDHALVGDAVLLQRLLANLVHNAIDASPPGKIVTLSAMEHAARGLRLTVIDQGNGIAPEHLARVFEPYFTTKEFGDEVRGFGLGLTICQKIVHLHHGTISVQSRLGYGTVVTIDLPRKQPASGMTEVPVAEYASARLTSTLPR